MSKIAATLALATTLSFGSNAVAQSDNAAIDNFDPTRFSSCYQGEDLGRMTKVSNPLLLVGSIAYLGPVMTTTGVAATGWLREPLALPVVTADSTSPDVATCSVKFEVTASGNLSFLGFSTNATRGDVYEAKVRLISRQSIAFVPENGSSVTAWHSARYREQFRTVVSAIPSTTDTFYLFDNISIYLLEVTRYQRRSTGGIAAFGLFSGGINYDRVDNFSGTKIIVTGDPVGLYRANYASTSTPQLTTPAVPVTNNRVINVLRAGDVAGLQSALSEFREVSPQ